MFERRQALVHDTIVRKEEKMRKIGWTAIAGFFILFFVGLTDAKDPLPPKKTSELLQQGKKLYGQNCETCHGPKGDGKGVVGAALKPPPRDFNIPLHQWTYAKGDLKKVFEVISKGIPNTSMVKWEHLSERDRWALTYYVVEFATPRTPAKKK